MRSDVIIVTSQGSGMLEALAATEKLGAESGLDRKENLRLRLLAEELFGMVRSIVGDVEARYWLEQEDSRFEIHLQSDVEMTQETRRQLIAVSTQGENAAARGFMGKLRDMIAAALLPSEEGPSMLSLGFMTMGSPGGMRAGGGGCDWTLSKYRSEVENGRSRGGAAEDAWDELEKSIVASIADEIRVRVKGSAVEITIAKTF